jgi:hypothetical protein
MLEVQRGEERLRIPVTPTPSGSDGSGRIGITLAANAKIVKKKGGDVVATVALAADEFVKLTGTVVGGALVVEGWGGGECGQGTDAGTLSSLPCL